MTALLHRTKPEKHPKPEANTTQIMAASSWKSTLWALTHLSSALPMNRTAFGVVFYLGILWYQI